MRRKPDGTFMRMRLPWSLNNFDDGYVSVNGRFKVWLPNHPRADSGGYVYRAVVAYEAYHGLMVPLNMMVHHIDGDALNDSKENLRAVTRHEHSRYHDFGEKSILWKGDKASPNAKYMRALRVKRWAIADGRLTPEIEAEYERAKIVARPHWMKEGRARRAKKRDRLK